MYNVLNILPALPICTWWVELETGSCMLGMRLVSAFCCGNPRRSDGLRHTDICCRWARTSTLCIRRFFPTSSYVLRILNWYYPFLLTFWGARAQCNTLSFEKRRKRKWRKWSTRSFFADEYRRFQLICWNVQKGFLPVRESNPGLPRDRRGYWPLY